jgi:hypothetical protein
MFRAARTKPVWNQSEPRLPTCRHRAGSAKTGPIDETVERCILSHDDGPLDAELEGRRKWI